MKKLMLLLAATMMVTPMFEASASVTPTTSSVNSAGVNPLKPFRSEFKVIARTIDNVMADVVATTPTRGLFGARTSYIAELNGLFEALANYTELIGNQVGKIGKERLGRLRGVLESIRNKLNDERHGVEANKDKGRELTGMLLPMLEDAQTDQSEHDTGLLQGIFQSFELELEELDRYISQLGGEETVGDDDVSFLPPLSAKQPTPDHGLLRSASASVTQSVPAAKQTQTILASSSSTTVSDPAHPAPAKASDWVPRPIDRQAQEKARGALRRAQQDARATSSQGVFEQRIRQARTDDERRQQRQRTGGMMITQDRKRQQQVIEDAAQRQIMQEIENQFWLSLDLRTDFGRKLVQEINGENRTTDEVSTDLGQDEHNGDADRLGEITISDADQHNYDIYKCQQLITICMALLNSELNHQDSLDAQRMGATKPGYMTTLRVNEESSTKARIAFLYQKLGEQKGAYRRLVGQQEASAFVQSEAKKVFGDQFIDITTKINQNMPRP